MRDARDGSEDGGNLASLVLEYRLDEEVTLAASPAFRHVERWEVAVLAGGSSPDRPRVEIGRARVLIFNLEAGDEIGDFADRASGTWVDADLHAERSGAPGPPGDDERQPTSHVLLLDQVWLRPDARGQGLGPIVAAAVIERLGRGCHLATCYPAPFESPPPDPEGWAHSVEALGQLWSEVGFTHWRDGVWMLDLDAGGRHGRLAALLAARGGPAPRVTPV